MSEQQRDGWNYSRPENQDGRDARKFVTLSQDGMKWVGIRAWHLTESRWYNGNEPELAKVLAWREMPEIAKGF